ncbi:MAG TPA: hypothetical protein VHQ90_26515 [Thermoanaerobaculia bacterium]|nr:hypothetical protein [Thermoanaerobaculia bacterium]
MYVLALLGLGGLAAAHSAELVAWLHRGRSHWALLVFGLLSVAAVLALYAAQKEIDDKTVVRLLSPRFSADFRPILNYGPATTPPAHDVLCIQFQGKLRNETLDRTEALFPRIELFERSKFRRWGVVAVMLSHKRWRCGGVLGFSPKSAEIPARKEIDLVISTHATSPVGAAAFLGKDFKLRITIDVLGQPPIISEGRLALKVYTLTGPPADATAPPPAGPPSTTGAA